MIVVYTPEGQEPGQYDASTLRVSEASIVQRTVDMKWQEILEGLERDDLDAMRAIVWVIKKRSEPSLRWGDFDPGVTEMTSRMSNTEVRRYVEASFAATVANDDLTRDDVARILHSRVEDVAVDPEYAAQLIDRLAAEEAPKEQPEPEPEAIDSSLTPTSSTPGTPSSDSSPTSSTSPQPESTTSSSTTSTS